MPTATPPSQLPLRVVNARTLACRACPDAEPCGGRHANRRCVCVPALAAGESREDALLGARVRRFGVACPLGRWPSDDEADGGDVPLDAPLAVVRIPLSTAADRIREQGPSMWADLHRRSLAGAIDARWLDGFTARVPCGDCRRHWQGVLAEHPLPTDGQFEWSVRVHAAVSRRIGKPEMSVEDARRIWSAPAAPTADSA